MKGGVVWERGKIAKEEVEEKEVIKKKKAESPMLEMQVSKPS